MKVVRFLVRSRIWVALASSALCADVWLANNTGLPLISMMHVFFLSLSGYLFVDTTHFRFRKPLMYIALTGAVLGILADPLFNLWPLLLATLLLLLYKTEWLGQSGLKLNFEFRNLIGVKNVVIALCWTLISSAAYLQLPAEQPVSLWWWLFANLLFVFVLSVAEDVQDLQHDSNATIASTWGINRTLLLCFIFLLFSVIIVMRQDADQWIRITHLLVCTLAVILFLYLRKPRSRDIASFFIDGLIVLKGMLPLLYYAWA